MSTDPTIAAQRRGIHERARKQGYAEGLSSAANQLSAYIPDVGRLSVYALAIGMEAKEVDGLCIKRFGDTDWPTSGIDTLEDMTIADNKTLEQIQAGTLNPSELIRAIDLALPVFNLRRQ